MELIKITEQNGQQVVSARELHSFLEVGARFNDWIQRMMEYGFTENVDYQVLLKNEYNPNLELIFQINTNVEKNLHDLYKEKRGMGEWFNLTDEDIKHIKEKYK